MVIIIIDIFTTIDVVTIFSILWNNHDTSPLLIVSRRTLSSGQSSSNESLNGSESNGTRRAKRKKTTNAPQRGLVNGTLGGLETVSSEEAPLLQSLLNGPRPITTVAIIKPEATEKPLGRVLRRFAQEGFSVVAMRMENLEKEVAMALCQDRQAADKVVVYSSVIVNLSALKDGLNP